MSDRMNDRLNDRMNDQELDDLIRRELLSVSAPVELRQKLLQPEQTAPRTMFSLAANDSLFRRALPVAACLVVALGITFWSTDSRQAMLEDEIFTHMYLEGQLDNENAAAIPLNAVNARMEQWMGAHLAMSDAVDGLEVTFAKDCWVAQQMAFHLIMKGETGAVTVMMIPSDEKGAAFNISDEKYNGLVTPTDGGYLVVVGNKQEPIAEYRNLLSDKLEWEY
jgi:hypothetical protein